MRAWIRRWLLLFVLCVVALLVFPYALEVRSSDAENPFVPGAMAALPRVPVPEASPSAPRFAVAAREGIAELLGSGDGSIVGWRYATGLWGEHIKPNWWQSALALRAEGFTEEQLARVHGPIGLDLGGRGAEETALGILAEITAVRFGGSGASKRDGVRSGLG